MAIWGYVRVSMDHQYIENQKLSILEYANRRHLPIDKWIEAKTSSHKSTKGRRIDEMLALLREGDTVIVTELSKLGISLG
ncbi:MAG TPA: recombinase family protein, partial [Syntrophorhabdaceae bacterium]